MVWQKQCRKASFFGDVNKYILSHFERMKVNGFYLSESCLRHDWRQQKPRVKDEGQNADRHTASPNSLLIGLTNNHFHVSH